MESDQGVERLGLNGVLGDGFELPETLIFDFPTMRQIKTHVDTLFSLSRPRLESDLEREKSISLDASLNEKRILEEKNELLKTEKQL